MTTWTPERSTVNQRVQIGAESTSALGTPVAASKLLECFDFQFGVTPDLTTYTPTGHKYPTIQELNEEETDGTMGGNGDYNGLVYPLSSVGGAVAPVAHGTSTTAKDWIITPPTTGSVVPQTYTFEQGDSVRAHRLAYGLYTDFGYQLDRKSFTVSGKIIAHPLDDGISMTATPTAVPLAPIVPSQVNIYLDTTSAALGTTQLTKFLQATYALGGMYGPAWFVNRANPGFSAHVDLAPSADMKLMVEADEIGMSLLNNLRAGQTIFVRVEAIGDVIDADNSISNTFQHDMALKVGKPGTFSDSNGIFAIEWDCQVVEDTGWGKAQVFTLTNLLTSL